MIRSISSWVLAQTPLLIVQRNTAVVPAGTPVIVVAGELALVINAVPLSTVQVPVPMAAAFALIVKMPVLHCSICTGPASATVGVA